MLLNSWDFRTASGGKEVPKGERKANLAAFTSRNRWTGSQTRPTTHPRPVLGRTPPKDYSRNSDKLPPCKKIRAGFRPTCVFTSFGTPIFHGASVWAHYGCVRVRGRSFSPGDTQHCIPGLPSEDRGAAGPAFLTSLRAHLCRQECRHGTLTRAPLRFAGPASLNRAVLASPYA